MNPLESSVSAANAIKQVAWKLAGKSKRLIRPQRDYVVYEGSTLPPRGMRFNGPDHEDEAFYLGSARMEAARVADRIGYVPQDLIVDLGCGQGRLAIGLARRFPTARYVGLDVSLFSVIWCSKYLSRRYPTYEFKHVDILNARYNPNGQCLSRDFRLPVADGAASIVYAWGVVTNMEPEHLEIYARDICRMLRPGGVAYLTANLEDDVPPVSINPRNYVSFDYNGPLHIVRYEKQHFVDVFESAGLKLQDYVYHAHDNCQSDLYFIRA